MSARCWRLAAGGAMFLGFLLRVPAGAAAQERFPHERHGRLFPVCSGCHAGIESGDAEAVYPKPTFCATCHDGRLMRPVPWEVPGPRASNLRFSHATHQEELAAVGESARCQACHGLAGRTEPMAVGAPASANCRTCHAPRGGEHLVESSSCSVCHLPLVEAKALSAERIARFPRPASHEAPDFPLTHSATSAELGGTRCSVCHAQESCTRCHLNATSVPAIQVLGSDARVAALVEGRAPRYSVPPDHAERRWELKHATAASASAAACANCHTRASCETCHRTVEAGSAIASLPAPASGDARGVRLGPTRVFGHVPGFETAHAAAAAAERPRCSACHAEESCAACHEGAAAPRFHVSNFMVRHGSEAFGRMSDCASCHNTEAFCRACHTNAGLPTGGRTGAAFHDAQPLWLLGHAQAARQGLESCVACHSQADCLRCHSSVRGWGVNPHGPDFDASRVADRNRLTCRRCHAGDPLQRP